MTVGWTAVTTADLMAWKKVGSKAGSMAMRWADLMVG